MKPTTQRFFGILLLVMGITFGIHILVLKFLEKPLFAHQIIWTYLVNYALALLVIFMVERSVKAKSAQAGFVFLSGGGLKFLIFFLIFYPSYKVNGEMETIEFITFFIPYSLCLILEVWHLSKQLNKASLQGGNSHKKNT